jgi:hypothetical protein
MSIRVILFASVVFTGCSAAHEPTLGTVRQKVASENALSTNRLAMNRLAMNRLAMNRLAMNRLAMNGLLADFDSDPSNSVLAMFETSPGAVEVAQYIVSCAAPEGFVLELPHPVMGPHGEEVSAFEGLHGLAPEWVGCTRETQEAPEQDPKADRYTCRDQTEPLDGSEVGCGETCQRWISACLFARANANDVSVRLSMRGKHEQLATTEEELAGFPLQEGAFWGNLWRGEMYACYGYHGHPTESTLRDCTRHGSHCPMQVLGPCGAHVAYTPYGAQPLTFSERGVLGEATDDAGRPAPTTGYFTSFPTISAERMAHYVHSGVVLDFVEEQPGEPTEIGITVYLEAPEDVDLGYDPDIALATAEDQLAATAPHPTAEPMPCGDGVCSLGENITSCPADCGEFHAPPCEEEWCE